MGSLIMASFQWNRRPRQRGSVTVFALIALLLMFLGALYAFRGTLLDTSLTDKASVLQKNIQASDLALQALAQNIVTTYAGSPLEISAASAPWFNGTASPVTPTPNYWAQCQSGSRAQAVCAALPMPAGVPQQAWGFVQPTGRVDPYGCQTQTTGLAARAVYYDLWVHVVDPRTGVAADTESVYRLCVTG
jgi:hypothetical protein